MRGTKTLIALVAGGFLLSGCPGEKKDPPKKPDKPVTPPPKEPPKPTPPPEPTKPATGGKGSIKGSVGFTGAAPAAVAVKMNDPKCKKLSPGLKIQEVEAKDGKLKNVFVYIKSGLPKKKWDAPKTNVVLDNKGCDYEPKVVGLQVGQKLELLNSDPLLHNVNSQGKRFKFNVALPKQGMKIEKKAKKPEVLVHIKCDVHSWMHAWAGITEHPFFAVTDASGAFEMKDVPAGKYTVAFVHPKLGEKTQEITVEADKAAEAAASFAAK